MSLLNRACKILKSSPRSGLLTMFEQHVGEFNSGISSIGDKDSLFLVVELDEVFISGVKTAGDEFLSVCPLSLKSMSSSLTAINRGIRSNPIITAAPLAYPAEENAACFCETKLRNEPTTNRTHGGAISPRRPAKTPRLEPRSLANPNVLISVWLRSRRSSQPPSRVLRRSTRDRLNLDEEVRDCTSGIFVAD
uniref:Uncharacterized protein n=1 Tax=Cucumis sativus TaxID=3659 RepID=A0A0A0LSL1_CUCSA